MKGTNNQAEYKSAIMAMQLALDRGLHGITIRGDSTLVVNQLNGKWKVCSIQIIHLWKEAKALMEKGGFRLEWIPRAQNQRADQLAFAAMISDEEGAKACESSRVERPAIPEGFLEVKKIPDTAPTSYRGDQGES